MPTREMPGAICLRVSTIFPITENSIRENPVRLPPGRARLSTKPDPKKSLATATIGIERVNCVKTGIIRALTEGTDDAHSTLRRLYLDEAQNPNTRVRAAQAALNVEKPRLESVPPPLDLAAEPYESLADKVTRMRAYVDALAPKLIEETAKDNEMAARAWRNGGNGDNSSSGDQP